MHRAGSWLGGREQEQSSEGTVRRHSTRGRSTPTLGCCVIEGANATHPSPHRCFSTGAGRNGARIASRRRAVRNQTREAVRKEMTNGLESSRRCIPPVSCLLVHACGAPLFP